MGRLTLLAGYLLLLPTVLLALVGYLIIFSHFSNPHKNIAVKTVQFQALPEEKKENVYFAQISEARVQVLKEFFDRYKSPLLGHENIIVSTADKYKIDWRLLPAIAMQESTLCKKIPKNSFNCWGFGIYSGKVTRFENLNQAIETVSKSLAHDYKEKRGLELPHEIVTRYTPGSTTWADGVTLVMNRIASSL